MRLDLPALVLGVSVDATLGLPVGMRAADQTVLAVGAWLAARWLPAPAWNPDPAWLEIVLPELPIPPAGLSVLSGLVQARLTCTLALGIDPALPARLPALARIVVTLNRRLDLLAELAADPTPWDTLAALNDGVDIVVRALDAGLLAPPTASAQLTVSADAAVAGEPSIGPWRVLLAKIKALAPLIALFRALQIDPAQPGAVALLAEQVRLLRAITLPPIAQPLVLFQLINRFSAILRLQTSLGADPRTVPFSRVQLAVQRKVDALALRLPASLRLADGVVLGLPPRQPNPSLLLNPATIAHAQAIPFAMMEQLRWQVPEFQQLALLTTAAPLMSLVQLLRQLGIDPVMAAPCGGGCDAGTARDTQPATTMPGSGTGAMPAG